MLLMLANTTDKVQLVTDAAVNVDVVVSFSDVVKASGAIVSAGDRQVTAISTATTTDILAAPASSNVRKLKGMTARNKSTTTNVAVTVVLDANGTDYELHKVTLKPGECLEFLEGIGFFVLGAVPLLDQTVRVTGDVVNATTSFADITGLTVAIAASKVYTIEMYLSYITNATTTGARFGINGPASPTLLWLGGTSPSTPGIASTNIASGVAAAYDTAVPAASTTGPGATRAIAHIQGLIENGTTAGNLVARFQSEVAVASGLTVQRGSWMRVREIP